ncbi:MAG TPA: hypothetical protein EYQ31_11505 [Candidatus Handelsmanbacteria bacterium]|jgi:hypothetical protein|nr:hypothetical protein [Candidatus Latescibacterota bacterium]HIG17844.1 hypothetical protein [Candidatus Handelsmanbacteria bacterium]|tara:strand:- start:359 stop:841 length:483 start_codon:yes stop_codon:yes gene_type:complete
MSRWGDTIDSKLKRAGALVLTFWTVLLLPTGLGLVLLGVSTRIENRQWQEPLSVGVGIVAVGAITWYLSRRLHEGARQVRARIDENRILRLASQRAGRLTVMEAATETGLTAAECEEILRGLAEGGFIEIEVSDAGIMIYRFPDVLYGQGGGRWHERILA